MELLCPAGSMESFYQAVNHGADAVYLSGKQFGARSFAQNFSKEELETAITLGKIYGVKVYVTMNTLVKEEEIPAFLEQVQFLIGCGVDAILMQDFGMICLCREMYPELEIHASTQANSCSLETIDFLADLGVKRIVLPREMTLEEIKQMKTPVELEVFVHGALCVSYSGCCLFSSRLGARSGNRGSCAGPCRLKYRLYQGENFIKEGYLLSMKELNLSEDINKLSGLVASLKIEGRMKSPSYVAFVTDYYRTILDGKELSSPQKEDLQSLFYRGFTKGHLLGDKELINSSSPNHIGLEIGKVVAINDEKITIKLTHSLTQGDGIRFLESNKGMMVNYLYDENGNFIHQGKIGQQIMIDNKPELITYDRVSLTTNQALLCPPSNEITKKVPLTIHYEMKIGLPCKLILSDGIHTVCETGEVVERAKTAGLSKERVESQLLKLGNSPFCCSSITGEMDENIFLRLGALNVLRRTLCERLIGERINEGRKERKETVTFSKVTPVSLGLSSYQDLPRNLFSYKEENLDKKITNNLFDARGLDVLAGPYLNVFNSYTAYYLYHYGYRAICLSTELSIEEQRNLIVTTHKRFGPIPLLVKSQGKVEVMLIKGNPLDLEADVSYELVHEKGHKFPVSFDGKFTHLLSHDEINIPESFFADVEVSFLRE